MNTAKTSNKTSKPSKKEVVNALEILLKWATGGNRTGNPYCVSAIKHAMKIIARERGMAEGNYLDIDLRDLPIPGYPKTTA
jgi:hypothetical protein